MDRLEIITNEILTLLEAKLPISTYNFSDIPMVYAKSLYYENESVVLNIINQAGADTVQLIGNGLQVETGDRKDFQHILQLSGAHGRSNAHQLCIRWCLQKSISTPR